MPLAQAEADEFLRMPKKFIDESDLEFRRTEPMDSEFVLRSHDRREEFLFNIERGDRDRLRLKYQTRARKVIVLARLELNGPRHKNPPGQPYRPGEWLPGTHMHLYREGFDDRVAYLLADVLDWHADPNADDVEVLEEFLRFCGVDPLPLIQLAA